MENKKKISLLLILCVVSILVLVNIIQPAQFGFVDNTDYQALQKQAALEAEQYKKILADANPNYAASQQLLEKIATDDIVKEQLDLALNTNQKIVIPEISNTDVKIASRTDNSAMVDYLNNVTSISKNYNSSAQSSYEDLFAPRGDTSKLSGGLEQTKKAIDNLKSLSVPKDAVELHKANLVVLASYRDMYQSSLDYSNQKVTDPWADLYKDYRIIDNRLAKIKTEANKIAENYALDRSGGFFIKTANAQFATATVITADLERAVIEGVKAGLAKSFANFAIQMLDKLIAHIEKNFAIASQLYYSNELGRYYSVEYMKKFVSDPIDQDIIQKFLPEYFCIQPKAGDLKKIFQAKARENIGTDLIIDPNDPQFLQKLAKLGGDEKNYPEWWEGYYQALASQTQSQAESAANKEVLSPGLKSARDIVNNQITKTMASVFNTQEAAINGTINLGTNNADNIVGQITANIVQSLVDKFVFTPLGASTSGSSSVAGSIGILQEKNVCLAVPQIKPVAPLPNTTYSGSDTTPPFVPR